MKEKERKGVQRGRAEEEIKKEGQDVWVKLLGFDDRGKVRLAMKMVDQATGEELAKEKEEAAE